MVLQVLWVLCIDMGPANYFIHRSWQPWQFSLALGPLIFFYVRKKVNPEYKSGWKDLLHFSPLLPALGAIALEIREGTYDTLIFRQLNAVFLLLAFISVIIYLRLSHKQVERFYNGLKFNDGERNRAELLWLHRLLVGFGLIWLIWIPFTAVDYFGYHNQLDRGAYYPLYMLLSAMLIRVGVVAFLRPGIEATAGVSSFSKPSPSTELKQKGIWLKKTMEANLFHQDAELSLSSLGEKLDIHPHELSRIINIALKKNFNDFINEYRIREVVQKMQDPEYDRITLLGIAFESGFNSKSTFNRTFKQMTGKSPAEYKKERPTYHLRPYSRSATIISYKEAAPVWSSEKLNRNHMFKNYFKTAWRSLKRNKSYAAINIAGLAIGISSCLLIFLIVQFETSFDNFHSKKDHIYRVLTVFHNPDGVFPTSGTPLPLSEGLRIDFPQLKSVGAIMQNDGSHYSVGNSSKGQPVKKFKEDLAYFAEPQFFDIFDFKWLAGDKKKALAEPNTVVLTRDEANKFFGDWHDAMGKIVRYENRKDLKVTGILEDVPANTDFPMKLVISWLTSAGKGGQHEGNSHDWVSTFGDNNCYIILPDNVSVSQFDANLQAFVKKHKPADYVKDGMALQALADMHYNTQVNVYSGHAFSRQLIDVISLIGLFLLIIACVNFINLATAQAVNRSKEVGIRKVLGSRRKQLVFQFITETLIITVFAVVLAAGIAQLVLPMLNSLLEIKLSAGFLLDPTLLLFLLCVIIAVTLLSGFYPAMVLSGFNPIEALKNKIRAGRSTGISLRRVLVVFQFGIAQVLVIGTLVLIYQMNYFNNKSLGFNKDAVITVDFPGDSVSRSKINTLKDQLLAQPGIKDVSFSFASPSDNNGWGSDFKFNNAPKQTDFSASLKWADPEYFKLYGLQFAAGGPYLKSDTINSYVINETLMHKLGIRDPKEAIGKYIKLWDDKTKYARIVGVVKDYNIGSLRNAIPPVLMAPWKDVYQKLNIKIQPQNVSQTLASVEKLWNTTFPEGMYEYQFLDDKIANFYKSERQLSDLYKIFAGIAIFISCLGLYGLVSFMAVQRTKEVGIRKTLGASVSHIVYLFSKEFTVLILIAFPIAGGLGYYFMHKWLQDFTYKITIGPGIFIIAILSSVVIAWAAVGFKAVKAALANPVRSLRSE
jgi:predicted permease